MVRSRARIQPESTISIYCFCRHDFAVVETIDFFEDEDQELPPPMTQKDVILLNRAGAFKDEEAAVQAEKDDDDAMEVRLFFQNSER